MLAIRAVITSRTLYLGAFPGPVRSSPSDVQLAHRTRAYTYGLLWVARRIIVGGIARYLSVPPRQVAMREVRSVAPPEL